MKIQTDSLFRGFACALSITAIVVASGCDSAPDSDGGTGVISQSELQQIESQITDKAFNFSSSFGNGDNNAFSTKISDFTVCAFGRFGLREQTLFSSQVGSLDSTDTSTGAWKIKAGDGGAILELATDSSSETNFEPIRQFTVAISNNSVIVNGIEASVTDASAVCAGSKVEIALADKQISFSSAEPSQVAILLCGFGRFAMDEQATGSSSVDTSSGTWSVTTNGTVLDLAIDTFNGASVQGQRLFDVQVDANGQVFVDSSQATVTDISADCAAAQQ